MSYYVFSSPLGSMKISDNGEAVTEICLTDGDLSQGEPSRLQKKALFELKEYFEGKLTEFTLPLAPEGTEFQKKVWRALCTIPYGETRSYGEIAKLIGNPRACRAVGGANNKNPIMIVIPCHRVIGADGSLVGYAGGTDIKKRLLELERRHPS